VITILRNLDTRALYDLYRQRYPLFQRAYQDLGYPQGYFNDRLVEVIDHLLATPEVKVPVELVRPNVLWQYLDPELESRSSGQKLLLRLGPDNAAVVRTKLRELRALLVSTAKPAAPGAPAAPTVAPANVH